MKRQLNSSSGLATNTTLIPQQVLFRVAKATGSVFSMSDDPSERRNWTDEELDLIVSDYFLMLSDEAAGAPFNKARHSRMMRSKIDRSEGSIEFKHQNISAVLQRLGLPRIRG